MGVRIHSFRGWPAATLSAGDVQATFLPELGMLGTSLRYRDEEYLSLHGGLDAWAAGHTTGMPILHPWANRLGGFRYRVGSTQVDLSKRRRKLHTDEHGLPIHGVMLGERRWRVLELADDASAWLRASFRFDAAPLLDVFPFPHELEVEAKVDGERLHVTTTVSPIARKSVPIAFGWHPYFRLPGTRRADVTLHLPPRLHLELDDRGLPTGAERRERAESEPIGRRTFDDTYRLRRQRRLGLSSDQRALTIEYDAGYLFAQVFAPAGKPFVALEPMTAPTNALVTGEHDVVRPGDRFSASFTVSFDRIE
jgi:aldose 1-epimerase